MSFFGFGAKPGSSQATDPFADLEGEADDILEFGNEYAGLGKQLAETHDDDLNHVTFGDGAGGDNVAAIKSDFDFAAQTKLVADMMQQEKVRLSRPQIPEKTASATTPAFPPQHSFFGDVKTAKPARTGYEKYREPAKLPDMEVDASIWGVAPKKPQQPAYPLHKVETAAPTSQATSVPKKILSLEEVEAEMKAIARARSQKAVESSVPASTSQQPLAMPQPQQPLAMPLSHQSLAMSHTQQPILMPHSQQPPPVPLPRQNSGRGTQGLEFTRQPPPPVTLFPGQSPVHNGSVSYSPLPPHQRQAQFTPPIPQSLKAPPAANVPFPLPQRTHPRYPQAAVQSQSPMQPAFPNQSHHGPIPNRRGAQTPHRRPQSARSVQTFNDAAQAPVSGSPQLEQDARRAKRNHKLYLLSRGNGIMTPSDKNFVSRIQLLQLVAAAGNPIESGPVDLSEDFYFQVLNQLRGGYRQNSSQPLNDFAQTYLFQTGNRFPNSRRLGRVPENYLQRMQQQVQRAVEAAKSKPKNKQLVIEGSLGKISFSNAKTPKPLLTLKRTESGPVPQQKSTGNAMDRKQVLRSIENVYSILMELEDLERRRALALGNVTALVGYQLAELDEAKEVLDAKLWDELKCKRESWAAPIHPFVVFMSFAKGKKALPRIYRLLSDEKRAIVLTTIISHLDRLDVVRHGVTPTPQMREAIELFSTAAAPSLFSFFNTGQLSLAIALMSILIKHVNIELVAKSRIGISLLTMILSRPELLKNNNETDDQSWQKWVEMYNLFFNTIEPCLAQIFPGTVHTGEDVYVWQFLAAIGIGANLEQQQRLVLAVKDRVMDTVSLAKTLPASLATERLAHVNLFMRSIGLDVELLG